MKTTSSTLEDIVGNARTVIPGFDWLQLDRIENIWIEIPDTGVGVRLTIAARHPQAEEEDSAVIVQFDGAQEVQIPTLPGGSLAFGEFVIEDVRARQLEGKVFWVKDYLIGLSFYCQDIHVFSSWSHVPGKNSWANVLSKFK